MVCRESVPRKFAIGLSPSYCYKDWTLYSQCCKCGGTEVDGVHPLFFEGGRHPPTDRVSAGWTGVHPRPPTYLRGGWTPSTHFFFYTCSTGYRHIFIATTKTELGSKLTSIEAVSVRVTPRPGGLGIGSADLVACVTTLSLRAETSAGQVGMALRRTAQITDRRWTGTVKLNTSDF